MKYDEFEEENFNVDTLAITRRIDNLQYGIYLSFFVLVTSFLFFSSIGK